MNQYTTADWAAFAARYLVAGVLVAAAVAKALRPARFAYGIEQSLSVTTGLRFVAVLVAVELGVGIWLASGTHAREAIVVALGLFTLFTAYLVVQMRSRTSVGCGCFGGFGGRAGVLEIVRNVVLMSMLAGSLVFSSVMSGGAVRIWEAPLTVHVVTASVGAVLGLVYRLLLAAQEVISINHDQIVGNRA